jgi:hypothetical protein
MGVKVFNNATQEVIEVDPAAAAEGISEGRFTAAQKKIKVKRAGQTGQVDASQLANARGHGWEVTDEAGAAEARQVIEAHSTGSQIRGGAEALAAGASLGLAGERPQASSGQVWRSPAPRCRRSSPVEAPWRAVGSPRPRCGPRLPPS